jgi:hypothetical protein
LAQTPGTHLSVPPLSFLSRAGGRYVLAAAVFAVVVAGDVSAGARPDTGVTAARSSSTGIVSRATGGGTPNGASTNAVMSNDKRFVRAIAFESEASHLVSGDSNGVRDVFVTLRGNSANNKGTPWKPGRNILISRTASGAPSNGPSYSPSIDGSFRTSPTCVGFLSSASNIVSGDTNGQPDAFLKKIRSGKPKRLRPKGAQPQQPATAVAVSGNCKLIAFVTGGKLYVSKGGRPAKHIKTAAAAADPAFSTGIRNDLVFGARGGVYLLKNGGGRPKLVGRGGRNPVYNDIKRPTVAYEKKKGGHWQIGYHQIGKRERIISRGSHLGNGNSRNPVIGNSGFFVTYESDANNLSRGDKNRKPDIYLYTDTRKINLLQSINNRDKGIPGGGKNPAMNFYANYILFDSPSHITTGGGARQIFLHYRGGI